jgi:hypothetical protein
LSELAFTEKERIIPESLLALNSSRLKSLLKKKEIENKALMSTSIELYKSKPKLKQLVEQIKINNL